MGDWVPVEGVRGACSSISIGRFGPVTLGSGQSCQMPPCALQIFCSVHAAQDHGSALCVRACMCVCVCVHVYMCLCVWAASLTHAGAHHPLCPFQWVVVLPPFGSPTLVAVGAAGPWMCAHLIRVAFHSYMLINVCPLPALSRGILVTPGIRLTPSS